MVVNFIIFVYLHNTFVKNNNNKKYKLYLYNFCYKILRYLIISLKVVVNVSNFIYDQVIENMSCYLLIKHVLLGDDKCSIVE